MSVKNLGGFRWRFSGYNIMGRDIFSLALCMGLLLTYGLATRHACYAPATRPLRARYSPSIYMCGSPKTRRYLLNKSSNTIIWRLNIRQVNKDLYVEVESPRQVVNQ